MYVKLFNENIRTCGNIECGCVIVEVESPHIIIKLCKKHEADVKHDHEIHAYISPIIDNPGKFESLHLAAIGSKSFE